MYLDSEMIQNTTKYSWIYEFNKLGQIVKNPWIESKHTKLCKMYQNMPECTKMCELKQMNKK